MQFLVLGMHRSGTSALARVLALMGCHVGADDELAPGDRSNPKGYWERKDVWALDERMLAQAGASWHDVAGFDALGFGDGARATFAAEARSIIARLDARRPWAVKDPRLCLLLPLWRPLLAQPVCVLVQRDPLEVARSLQKRDGFPLAAGIALWERYLGDALRHSAGLPRVIVSYERLVAQPADTVGELLGDLRRAGVPQGTLHAPAPEALASFLDPSLHHQRTRQGQAHDFLNDAQRELYARVAGPAPFDDGPPQPPSAAGRDALDSLARLVRQRTEHVRLLEDMMAEKDRYVTALVGERERMLQAQAAQAQAAQEAPARAAREQAAARERERDWSAYAVCTIVSRNYLSLARACCRSFREHHPGARAFVLIVDELGSAASHPPDAPRRAGGESRRSASLGFDPASEPFECVPAEGIGIPDFADFAFKYSILELNTAVKPAFLEYLFEQKDVQNVFYLDPDIYVYGPLIEARRALEAGQAVLTPHLLRPIPRDGRRPQEQDILSSGTYNLGFLGLRRGAEALDLLHWWHERLYDGAFSDPARGLFTDQKWMNLAPGLFSGVGVLRHAGYNVAYWNLHERGDLAPAEDGYTVRGEPLRFFHFSGYDRRHPARVSKHQDRFRVPDLNRHYRDLFAAYGDALAANGWAETRLLPYTYGRFDNGAPIPDFVRRAYFALGDERHRFGDPFKTAGEGSFFSWLLRPHRPGAILSPLLLQMRECRGDLRQAFPDPEGCHLLAYLNWVLEHHLDDFGLGAPYDMHFRAAHAAALDASQPVPPVPAAARPEPVVALEGPPRRAWKRGLAALFGDEAYRRVRRDWIWPLYARLGLRFDEAKARVEVLAAQPRPFGVNLFGYLDTESGVGETGRGFAEILRVAGIPHALRNVEQPWLRRGDRSLREFARDAPYAVNLLVVNADQLPHVYRQAGLHRGGTYDIGFWAWELTHFPQAPHAAALALVDEIWTHSEFCRGAFAAATSVPVVKVLPALTVAAPRQSTRAELGFDDAFTFLYVFDSASIVKRKNPGAAISAFRRAFSPDEPVRLVLKTTNASARQAAALERLAGDARVSVRNGYLGRAELLDLLAACDAYVSLHRSEGLGLTLLETLMLDKPVVATRYSGVTEFLHGTGTYPVAFREVELRRAYGPYPKGSVWADPDPHDAARRMRELYEDWRPGGKHHGQGHGAAVRARYSPGTLAPALRARLDEIAKLTGRAR